MDFNQYKDTYTAKIEKSIRFGGKEHEFFTKVKADFLCKIINNNLPHVEEPHLLDVGCGHGFIHKHLANRGLKLVGIEIANEVLELAKISNPDVNYMSHDGKTIPFAEDTFDVVFAICVMHHVPPEQWVDFLFEMKRVLKKNGIAVIFEHNPYNPATRYIVANNELDADAVLLSSKKLKALMRNTGFDNRKTRNILFTPFSHPVFRWLDNILGNLPIGAQYYAIGRKP